MSARAKPAPAIEPGTPIPAAVAVRLTYRFKELAAALGVSTRALERERSAGRFPAPDLHIGRVPLWKIGTVQAWIDGGGR